MSVRYPPEFAWLDTMLKTYEIHVASGHLVVIDPMFVDCAVNPRGESRSVIEQPDFIASSGIEKLILLEMAAMGSTRRREVLRTIGYIDLTPCEKGTYSFALKDIRRMEFDPDADPTAHFSLDTGQFLIFDLDYLDGVLRYFDWKNAYSRNTVNRQLERKNGQLIANRDDVYTLVQSPGVNRGVEFVGDGEYTIAPASFTLVASDHSGG